MTLEALKVGSTAIVEYSDEDDDLNEFLDTFGNRIVITEVEEEDGELTGNFWGVNLTHKVHCPYHIEYRDVTYIHDDNIDTSKFNDFKCVEMNTDGEFVEV